MGSFRFSRVIVIVFALLIVIGGAFFVSIQLIDAFQKGHQFRIDAWGIEMANWMETDALNMFFGWLTDLGAVWFLTTGSIVVGVILLLVGSNRLWRFTFLAIAMLGISLLTSTLKSLFQRERPNMFEQFDGTGFSFPSGHSTGTMVFYGFIIYLILVSEIPRWLKALGVTLLSLLIVLIGWSRVYLGVHYVSDVIAGFLLGLVWLTVCLVGLNYVVNRRR